MVEPRVAPMSLSELKGPGEWTELNLTNLDLRSILKNIPDMIFNVLNRDDVRVLTGHQSWVNEFKLIAQSIPMLEQQINAVHSQHYIQNGKAIQDDEIMSIIVIGQRYVELRNVIDQHVTVKAISIVQAINDQLPEASRVRLGA